ncbi:MAG: hypothetical protein EOO24_12230 [Comamonadaceae bacterium]|nr:MAG: hypothetical protein EOO24_12230 [Comamonadaceae bacterium]
MSVPLRALRFFSGTRQAALLVALMVALWVAGTLGLVHRSVHGVGAPPAAVAAQQAVASSDAAQGHKHRHGSWVLALFGQHHDDADCRLYDQLSHGPAALAVPMIVLPLVLPVAVFDHLEGQALARWVALFDARGPPSSR